MALYPAPMTAILGAIATQNKGVTLTPSQYTFGAPTVYADPAGQTNTSMLITVAEVSSPYQGAQTVYYSRLKLSDLATLLPQPIQGNGWATVADFWAILNTNFGLNFVPGDLNDSTPLVIGSDGSGTVTLIAQAGSLGWVGQVTLSFVVGNYSLPTLVTNSALLGLLYPNPDLSKPFGELYSYWRDMSAYQADLQNYNTSSNDLTLLTADLKLVTGDAWTTVAAGRFSTMGATIAYNGTVKAFTPIVGTNCTPNPGYNYVIVVKLNASNSLGYSGYLFLHYSLIDQFANTDGPAVKTALLLHFDGINNATNMVDNVGKVVTVRDAVISTTKSKFGGSSWFWNNVEDAQASIADAPSLQFPAGQDMTIEGWFYPSNNTQNGVLFNKGATLSALDYNTGTLSFSTDQTTTLFSVANALTANAWNHVAVVKKSNVWSMYINGVIVATDNTHLTDTFGVNANAFLVGQFQSGLFGFQGYIDEFRVSTVARYSATFTPTTDIFYVD
jgi:hypothetical protein